MQSSKSMTGTKEKRYAKYITNNLDNLHCDHGHHHGGISQIRDKGVPANQGKASVDKDFGNFRNSLRRFCAYPVIFRVTGMNLPAFPPGPRGYQESISDKAGPIHFIQNEMNRPCSCIIPYPTSLKSSVKA
jgi:hypothetical protein